MGDVLDVKYLGIDPRTRKDKVSRRELLNKPEGYKERGNRNDRGGDRGRGDKKRFPQRQRRD
jgi:polyribonucleotide nucleotidyltransferase